MSLARENAVSVPLLVLCSQRRENCVPQDEYTKCAENIHSFIHEPFWDNNHPALQNTNPNGFVCASSF
jgi:hypothetical protein